MASYLGKQRWAREGSNLRPRDYELARCRAAESRSVHVNPLTRVYPTLGGCGEMPRDGSGHNLLSKCWVSGPPHPAFAVE